MINLNMDILLQVAAIFFLAFDRANNQGDFIKPYINSGKKIYQLFHEDNVDTLLYSRNVISKTIRHFSFK